MSAEEVQQYWQQAAANAVAEMQQVIQNQRNEIESLQRTCQGMSYDKTMLRAAIAYELREACQASLLPSSTVPVQVLSNFVTLLSDGLVPPIEDHNRKRTREPSQIPVSQQLASSSTPAASSKVCNPPNSPMVRAVQRMMYLQRRRFREDEEVPTDVVDRCVAARANVT